MSALIRASQLSDVAKALYGSGTERADAWARQRQDELDDGRLRAIVAEPRSPTETTDAARRRLDYVVRNRPAHGADAGTTGARHMPHTSTDGAAPALCGRAGRRRWWNVFSFQLRSSRWSMTTRCPASAAQRAT